MAITGGSSSFNASGVHRRAQDQEKDDIAQVSSNIRAELWSSWPNDAGFIGLDEHRGPISFQVSGHIPSWAAGSLFRTGPGQTVVEDTVKGTYRVSHWFDGFAHTHKFDILPATKADGCASVQYSSCRQAKGLIEDIKRRGYWANFTFGQRSDPCVGIFGKMQQVFKPVENNHNVVVERNVPGYKSQMQSAKNYNSGRRTGTKNLFLATDQNTLQEIDPDTLERIGSGTSAQLHPLLNGPTSCAHSQRDPVNGDLFNFNLAFGLKPAYRVYRVTAATGKADILATIPISSTIKPAYIHSMFLTENFVVLSIPSTHLGWAGVKVPWHGNIIDAIEPFSESRLVQWMVIDRKTDKGLVARFTTPAGFFFHSVNAFEEPGEEGGTDLNFDCIHYSNHDVLHSFYHDVIENRDGAARKFWFSNDHQNTCRSHFVRVRYTLPKTPQPLQPPKNSATIPRGEVLFSIPAPHAGELPSINASRNTLPYRYVYTAGTRGLSTLLDCIIKTDIEKREATIWAAPEGHTPGEAIFVPRPGGQAEDDGVLLSVILDGTSEKSYLLVLDATSLEEVGRAEASFAIAVGLHGTYAAEVY